MNVLPTVMQIKLKYRVVGNFKAHQHGADHSGGNGSIGRRKARGWRKGWANEYRTLMGIVGHNLPKVNAFGHREKKA